ncbi:hypothetical protein DFJ74DRAFT_772584 [Hyaloraphidium curvatum]|nr:hypothetical protein DFJ74DRAFT_772584 [Hyaloraphidium curvatum]
MICQLGPLTSNFLLTWSLVSAIGLVLLVAFASLLFKQYYWRPTYDTWRVKTNPKYPPAEMVRKEVVQMVKGLACSTFCPSLALYLRSHGYGLGYCGAQYGWPRLALEFLAIWVTVDLYEMLYHRLGHKTKKGWEVHKMHHIFHNPTVFAVIADEYLDQFVRALPLVLIPLLVPVNIDLLFMEFTCFFYVYGLNLHLGHEVVFDPHSKIINTGFHHWLHHAISTYGDRTYHTGFFFQIWDRMLGSVYTGECLCAGCSEERGERTREHWEKVEKPDYSKLLDMGFWVEGVKAEWRGDGLAAAVGKASEVGKADE